jgi:bifunctional non-homologous end joining protein LigD
VKSAYLDGANSARSTSTACRCSAASRRQWDEGRTGDLIFFTFDLLYLNGQGPRFRQHACKLGLEGAISKQADRPYAPGNRGIWVKSKCLNREEFVVVGWTDPEGSRSHIGALLLGYTPATAVYSMPAAQAPA